MSERRFGIKKVIKNLLAHFCFIIISVLMPISLSYFAKNEILNGDGSSLLHLWIDAMAAWRILRRIWQRGISTCFEISLHFVIRQIICLVGECNDLDKVN